jgi:hypothetical protein
MKNWKLTLGAAAVAAAGVLAGRAVAPQEAAAQVSPPLAAGGGPVPQKLERPHDVVVHMNYGYVPRENMPMEVHVSGALTWDAVELEHKAFLRLSNQAGKLWYVPLDKVDWIEATPIGGGAVTPR